MLLLSLAAALVVAVPVTLAFVTVQTPAIINTFGAPDLPAGDAVVDVAVVKTIKEGLERTGGYCPCRLARTEDNKCICKEFREQIADPEFEGFCHCLLYYKSK